MRAQYKINKIESKSNKNVVEYKDVEYKDDQWAIRTANS
jgi:hypothetical protein